MEGLEGEEQDLEVDGLEGETEEEGVTIIDAGSDQGVNKDGCAMGCEGWAEAVDIA